MLNAGMLASIDVNDFAVAPLDLQRVVLNAADKGKGSIEKSRLVDCFADYDAITDCIGGLPIHSLEHAIVAPSIELLRDGLPGHVRFAPHHIDGGVCDRDGAHIAAGANMVVFPSTAPPRTR